MSWTLLAILVAVAGLSMLLERAGAPVVLRLSFKGDVKRESAWLAQFGQGACTLAIAALVWRMDPRGLQAILPLLAAVFGASLAGLIIKRLCGRVRPNRENAGRFLGFTLRHDNARESFPSTHSASAVALAVVLSALYPAGTPVFWTLAILCAGLRYIMDAHWPSDVLAGIALGYALAWAALTAAPPSA